MYNAIIEHNSEQYHIKTFSEGGETGSKYIRGMLVCSLAPSKQPINLMKF